MSFARLLGFRPDPDDVPMEDLAAALESGSTARMSTTTVYRNRAGREFLLEHLGLVDTANQLRWTRRAKDGAEHLSFGRDIFHRLPEKERSETGKTWRWEGRHECPHWENESGEIPAAVRSHVARPVRVKAETLGDERLRRYTLRISAGREHEDPVIVRMYEHMRYHHIKRVWLDIWLTEDGRLWRTRQRISEFRAQASKPGMRGMRITDEVTDHWDFGIVTDLSAPEADQILWPATSAQDRPGAV